MFLLHRPLITHVYCRAGSPLWCCHNAWEKDHICKFVKCNNCKEREDDKLCKKLGLVRLPRDVTSSEKNVGLQ